MNAVVLNDRNFNRLQRVVRRAEQGLFGDGPRSGFAGSDPITHVLKIQSGAANAFGYPARIQTWSDSAGSWSDYDTTEVRVEDPNGGTFAENQYVPNARLLGVNTSGVACFSAKAGGGGLALEQSALIAVVNVPGGMNPTQVTEITFASTGTFLINLNLEVESGGFARGLLQAVFGRFWPGTAVWTSGGGAANWATLRYADPDPNIRTGHSPNHSFLVTSAGTVLYQVSSINAMVCFGGWDVYKQQ